MNKVNLNEQINKLRTSKKMTLATLAERLGVTTSTVAAYENGSRNPSFDVLVKIAQIFNVTIDNLIGYTNRDLIDVSGLSLSQRDNVQNLIATYKKFNLLLTKDFGLDESKMELELEPYLNSDFEKFKESVKKK